MLSQHFKLQGQSLYLLIFHKVNYLKIKGEADVTEEQEDKEVIRVIREYYMKD